MEADKTDSPQNPEQKTSWLKLLLALLLGLGLLWFAFKDCDFEMILANLKDLDIFYLVVVFITGLLSHIVRACAGSGCSNRWPIDPSVSGIPFMRP